MANDTDIDAATMLLDLEGLAVQAVEVLADGSRRVRLVTAAETAAACPGCGVFSTLVKEYVTTRPRDVPLAGRRLLLEWRKRRWCCREPLCRRRTFTESVPAVPARSRLTSRLRRAVGEAVMNGTCATVAAAARAFGVSWPTVMDAVRLQAGPLVEAAAEAVTALGIDEVRRGRPRWRPVGPVSCGHGPVGEPAKARVLADRWHVGFTDLAGGRGMLGQVQGRTADDVAYWLACQTPAWRDRIRVVAIDMCTVFVAAIRRYLPGATLVIDSFHVVQLATTMLGDVRRRAIREKYGRRGRSGDPEYGIKNLLLRNLEHLRPEEFDKILHTLGQDSHGQQITLAWIAKEKLRDLIRLRATITGHPPTRAEVREKLTDFFTWCADHCHIPELRTLATTIDRWREAIINAVLLGVSNAASEGYNRVVKLDARNAYGYRNPENQRLRTRCATTRRVRGCLDPA